jgi:hypothetical protein
MSKSKTTFTVPFECSIVGHTVQLQGNTVELFSGGGQLVDTQSMVTSCPSSPACGILFKGRDCPYLSCNGVG